MSKFYKSKFKNLDALVFENDKLVAIWIPQYGSKLASLQYKTWLGFKEILVQSRHKRLLVPKYGATFSDYDMSGFDECFPTIDECLISVDGTQRLMPDHGEVWAMPWKVTAVNNHGFDCEVYSPNFGYTLSKEIRIKGSAITIQYKIHLDVNRNEMPFIWTPHALFQVYQDTQIIVPKQMKSITNVSQNGGRLGDYGRHHQYPVPNNTGLASIPSSRRLDLRIMEGREVNNCEKYYFNERLQADDRFGFRNKYFELMMSVDCEVIPYLGVFKNQGGLGEYCFAIEPCSGIYDSTEQAIHRDTCAVIRCNETIKWLLKINIGDGNTETSDKH